MIKIYLRVKGKDKLVREVKDLYKFLGQYK